MIASGNTNSTARKTTGGVIRANILLLRSMDAMRDQVHKTKIAAAGRKPPPAAIMFIRS
jgi:hypothetical protein